MTLFLMERHELFTRSDGQGGTITYYYYDQVTWIAAGLVLAWLTWFLVQRFRRLRALQRQPRRTDHRSLKRVVKIKNDLTSRYLRPGFSRTIHAVGIGQLSGSDEYCIQVFVSDATRELAVGAGTRTLLPRYRGVPLVLIEMPMAAFLSAPALTPPVEGAKFDKGIREHQDVIIGGISGANTKLSGQSGTIGYFCTRKSKLSRRKEIHLLSNSHVFADLQKTIVDEGDLIMQPSPGEPANNRPIASLVYFTALKFDGDIKEPNHVDAAIAKLWGTQQHKPLIPLIGAVTGYVPKKNVEIGEPVRKFGRTTGYTEGQIFSMYLDIWIRYDRTGKSAFFQNQFLIEPALPGFAKFVAKGDSGSLVVDAEQHAVGLIFGGMSELPDSLKGSQNVEPNTVVNPVPKDLKRIESYGVANPISEVLDRLKIDLLV
jgi:hypothetical protein